jgi:RimJ/RimL family protein N-acetyltransferase
MITPSQYAETETLRTGLEICIRASRPDDADRLVEAFTKLDPESLYLRFFGPKKEISAAEMQRFKETDFQNRVILFCTVMQEGREIIIASGSYVRIGEDAAEVAFIVEEDFHRLGIAGRLLKHLGKIAADAGVKTFVAEVLPHNNAMLDVFKRSGWPMTSKVSDGAVHLSLTLINQDKAQAPRA